MISSLLCLAVSTWASDPAPAAPAATPAPTETAAPAATETAAPAAPVAAAPVDCTALTGDEKAKCEEAAKAAAAATDKSSKAKRSGSNRMEAESTDE